MFKMLGITMVIGSMTAFGVCKRMQFYNRVKALEQMILAINIMQRELRFNYIKMQDLIKMLSQDIKVPVGGIFKKLYKIVKIDDGLPTEYKWSKIFREYGEGAYLSDEDILIIINISSVLGKFDVSEQINSLDYYKNALNQNLTEAKFKCTKEGSVTGAVAVSIGIIIAIILV